MSTTMPSVAPITGRVRAYFAPVNRAAGVPTLFDPARLGRFDLNAPPAPWIDLGYVSQFVRRSGTKLDAVRAGAPSVTSAQVRSGIEATVALEFASWGSFR